MNNQFTRHLKCPWCNKGEALANVKAKVIISVQCGKCGHVFFGDLDTLKTEKGIPQRRLEMR